MKRTILAVSLAALCAVSACSHTVPIINPTFETSTASPSNMEKAIRLALLNRGWTVNSFRPGRFEATYRRGDEIDATITVTYVGRKVTIQHVRSNGLQYGGNEQGDLAIHKNYNRWVTFLERDIQRNVAAFQ